LEKTIVEEGFSQNHEKKKERGSVLRGEAGGADKKLPVSRWNDLEEKDN